MSNGFHTLNYVYSCLSPVEDTEALALEQIWLYHRYKNKVVEIQEKRRDLFITKRALSDPEIKASLEEREEIYARLDSLKKEAALERKNSGSVSEETKAAIKELQQIKEAINETLSAKRGEFKSTKAFQDIQEECILFERTENSKARQEFGPKGLGLSPQTYKLLKNDNPKKFKSYRGEGSFGIAQFENTKTPDGEIIPSGLPVSAVWGSNLDFQIDLLPPGQWETGSGRRNAKTFCRVRIAPGKKGTPHKYVVLPMLMHRPLPENGLIKRVRVKRWRDGRLWKWSVCISVEIPGHKKRKSSNGKAVGIDVGWKSYGDTIRAMTIFDGEKSTHIDLPERIIYKLEKAEGIRSVRDKNLREIIQKIQEWKKLTNVPDWLSVELKTVHLWRSPTKIVRLLKIWERFEGDDEIWEVLQAWKYRDVHLWDYESGCRRKGIQARQDFYRRLAADLSENDVVAVEKFPLNRQAKRKSVEDRDQKELGRKARGQRVKTGLGFFKARLAEYCKISGTRTKHPLTKRNSSTKLVEIPAKNTSKKCHACKHVNKNLGSERVYTCVNCKKTWDRDENAAKNIREMANIVCSQADCSIGA